MSDLVTFTVRPPLRCFGRWPFARGIVCAKPAAWMRPPINGACAQFFCDRCRQPSDVPIASDAMFRRLTVSLDVMYAACELLPAAAEEEATDRLWKLIEPSGGLICIHGAVHQVGRWQPSAPSDVPRVGKGGRR